MAICRLPSYDKLSSGRTALPFAAGVLTFISRDFSRPEEVTGTLLYIQSRLVARKPPRRREDLTPSKNSSTRMMLESLIRSAARLSSPVRNRSCPAKQLLQPTNAGLHGVFGFAASDSIFFRDNLFTAIRFVHVLRNGAPGRQKRPRLQGGADFSHCLAGVLRQDQPSAPRPFRTRPIPVTHNRGLESKAHGGTLSTSIVETCFATRAGSDSRPCHDLFQNCAEISLHESDATGAVFPAYNRGIGVDRGVGVAVHPRTDDCRHGHNDC